MTVTPPAALLPPAELVTFAASLVPEVIGAAGASAGRDTQQVARATATALEKVANRLDRPDPYPAEADIPAAIREACIALAVNELHRIRVNVGAAAYDDPDPLGARSEAVILNSIGPGNKARWGIG